MFVPDKLKLNKFKLVRLPRPVEYMSRFGLNPSPSSQYAGDSIFSVLGSKTEQMQHTLDYLKTEASKDDHYEK